MVKTRTDGQLAVPTEPMPTEQANVQLPTAEGEVGQQTKAHLSQSVNEILLAKALSYGRAVDEAKEDVKHILNVLAAVKILLKNAAKSRDG